jgi:hypothetical protein
MIRKEGGKQTSLYLEAKLVAGRHAGDDKKKRRQADKLVLGRQADRLISVFCM